jgi:hypothetical protein
MKTDFWKCGLCLNYCMSVYTCKLKELITMDRCFWKELTTGITTYKNEEVIGHNNGRSSSNSNIWFLAMY